MRSRLAVLITTGLTVFVLGTGGLLATNLAQTPEVSSADASSAAISLPSEPTATVAPDTTEVDNLLARDAVYRTRLIEANQIIAQANAAVASLQARQAELASQNQLLLERDAAYRQAIEQANALLQQQAAEALSQESIAAAPSSSSGSAPAAAPAEPSYEEEHPEADDHDDDDREGDQDEKSRDEDHDDEKSRDEDSHEERDDD